MYPLNYSGTFFTSNNANVVNLIILPSLTIL